ncbi:glycosyltransferase 87 family protein [Sphingomonas sp. KR1UV-12]|uniref:Glycosyltransferase 87 family protein n=1 Tax=Sphingomonas aurea TaxID=3063994 RepID=A0ABT9ELB7_9SPHN|nr:glycosyltransferase 87 family protein [Sphingomonas sp. KR1UV-12]MDP1027586.1 glycosyltransferase 87 family protein [Sphingomonas sp. KR1UV-12]
MTRARIGGATLLLASVAIGFVALTLLRPVDHDESQYVAAAMLTAAGRLPYRDYAYLQTPLQPFLFAPVVWVAGLWTWPGLRIVNALLGVTAVAAVLRGARAAGADARVAVTVAALFASCDILLFSVAVARNDALPVACFAIATALVAGRERQGWRAVATGALLALAAAAKISYAVPAGMLGVYALADRRERPILLLAGALPVAVFVAWTWWLSPAGFMFGTLDFPAHAPAQFYADRPWKMSLAAKLVDTLKFLALGAALPAVAIVARDAWRRRRPNALDMLLLGAIVAALLPSPTWRQYLLPVLPPLFIRLAIIWQRPPGGGTRRTMAFFAMLGIGAGVATTLTPGALHLLPAMRQADAARRAMDAAGVTGPVATLSPQFLAATGRLPDARFATGPFYYRSAGLLPPARERALHLIARGRRVQAEAVLIGGEGPATAGDATLDAALARAFGGTAIALPDSALTLLVRTPRGRPAGSSAGAAE